MSATATAPRLATNPVSFDTEGRASFMLELGDVFVITGRHPYGGRFKPIRTTSWRHAMMINLYQGSVWLERDGHRYLVRRVYA